MDTSKITRLPNLRDLWTVNMRKEGIAGSCLTYRVVNVRDYGAKGDGVTNDQPAFTKAFTAISNTGGIVYAPQGTYLGGAPVRVKANCTLMGAGIDATIIKLANNIQRNVIEMESTTTVSRLTVDGNQANNRRGEAAESWGDAAATWDGVAWPGGLANVEHGDGIATSWYESGAWNLHNNCVIRDVRVHDTLRNNLYIGGYYNTIENAWLSNAYTDHFIYATSCYNSVFRNVRCSGFATSSGLAIGTSASGPANNNVFQNITMHDMTPGKWVACEIPIYCRTDAGTNNVFENILMTDTGATGIIFRVETGHTDVTIRNLRLETKGAQYCTFDMRGDNVVVDNAVVLVTDDTRGTQGTVATFYGDARVNNSYFYADPVASGGSGLLRGVRLDTANQAINCEMFGVDIEVPGIALYCHDTHNAISYGMTGRFLNAATISTDAGVGTTARWRDITGYLTRNKGTATVASGATYATVTHGLAATPAVGDIMVEPASNMLATTNPVTTWWISNIGTTTFRINVNTDPGASGASFNWQARIE